ncbi:DUF3768 domain-containing protein [Altererythrobacter sp.]|nr:DUF3768 domain-containing protein [Altererythrobacter sp.]
MLSPDGHRYHTGQHSAKRLEIRALNDRLRQDCYGGYYHSTQGVQALGPDELNQIEKAMREFDDFTFANDPFGEHDFGKLMVNGNALLWKIDYYDLALVGHSPDPADPQVTTRVLTIMLAEEN